MLDTDADAARTDDRRPHEASLDHSTSDREAVSPEHDGDLGAHEPDNSGSSQTPDETLAEPKQRAPRLGLVLIATALIIAALAGLTGYLGYRTYGVRAAARQDDMFVQAARQAAVDLTTINYTHAEADVARILDSATGEFHDDFQSRAQPFIDMVKRARSTSQGNVTGAALESVDHASAQVIVAVSVKTTNAGGGDEQPRGWRMRLNVQQIGDAAKISQVQFVP